ncbi:hypothetical protein L2D14_12305 [Thalassospiraceae bacterium LMO-JJ14]|nr:hypothetical protein L2D14_12305 [Thalassospiraceae bacterium LMO-JJ14]
MTEDATDLTAADNRPHAFELRDDNLRLLFSEAAKRDLGERLRSIELGFTVLYVSVLLAVTGWVLRLLSVEPQTGISIIELLLKFDGMQNFMISVGLLVGGILAVLSPVVLTMLVIERRNCRREMKDLSALLKRYGRL